MSLRMCCSLVCIAILRAGLPLESTDTPMIRPGILRELWRKKRGKAKGRKRERGIERDREREREGDKEREIERGERRRDVEGKGGRE